MITTLKEAQDVLKQHWQDTNGVACPCCGQLVKLYKRRVYNKPAIALISLYRRPEGYHHLLDLDVDVGGSDFSKLKYWGLIEKGELKVEGKRTSGLWRITELGRLYVEGKHRIYKYALVYNDGLVGFDGKKVGIRDALKNPFDYDKLMQGTM